MKVFVRSSDLASGEKIPVVAYYDDDSPVKADSHGAGMTVISVPPQLLMHEHVVEPSGGFGPAFLSPDWHTHAGPEVMRGEARRRADAVMPPEIRLLALYELISLTLSHGADPTTWPSDAKNRLAELESKFEYVQEVYRVATTFPQAPANPAADSHWPTKLPAHP